MAKIQVIDPSEGTRVPFLRGILTRSLHEAGLPFDEAYDLASTIRQELGDMPEVTTEDLRSRVLDHLQGSYGPQITASYSAPLGTPVTIMVKDKEGQTSHFSRSQHQRCLQSSGLSSEDATLATTRIYQDLMEQGQIEIGSGQLGQMTYDRWLLGQSRRGFQLVP